MNCGIKERLLGRFGKLWILIYLIIFIKVSVCLLQGIPVLKVRGFLFGCMNWVQK